MKQIHTAGQYTEKAGRRCTAKHLLIIIVPDKPSDYKLKSTLQQAAGNVLPYGSALQRL